MADPLKPSQELGYAFRDLEGLLKDGGAPAWVLVVTRECMGKYVVALRDREKGAPAQAITNVFVGGKEVHHSPPSTS